MLKAIENKQVEEDNWSFNIKICGVCGGTLRSHHATNEAVIAFLLEHQICYLSKILEKLEGA